MYQKAFDLLNNKITFLVLDYNRPQTLFQCLKSIRERVRFENYEIITLINGGNVEPAYEMFKHGLTDKLLLSSKNEGSSLGTLRLVNNCSTDHFIYFQSDNFFLRDFTLEELNCYKKILENPEFGAIDFTGMINFGINQFSERAFMMNTNFYLSNDTHSGYGTGPFYNPDFKNTEQSTLDYINSLGKKVFGAHKLIGDSGKYSFFECPCGGIIKRRNDTHQLWFLKTPKAKFSYSHLTDDEWDVILAGKWRGGSIPKEAQKHAFYFWSNELDPLDKEGLFQ